jgi:hypothetical protein
MRRVAVVLAVLGIAALASTRADGCCMVPIGYRGDVDQSWQRAVLAHHDGHEELTLRIEPHFHGQEGPGYLEWVVTIPGPATGYAVLPAGGAPGGEGFTGRDGNRWTPVEPSRDAAGRAEFAAEVVDLHDRLQDLAASQEHARTRFQLGGSAREAPVSAAAELPTTTMGLLEVRAPVVVGPFEITAVRARGRAGLQELNAYLERRGFATEDPDHMRWFVERDFTFLCIHITPPGEEDHVGKALDLPALRIGFDTEKPYYPAKFSSRQGSFGLRLAIATSKPLEIEALRDQRQRLRGYLGHHRYENLWTAAPPPRAIAEAFPESGPHGRPDRWYLNVVESKGFNPTLDGKPAIASWTDDVWFPLGGSADEPPGWYYGDRDPWFGERFAREHGIAGGLALAVVAGVVLVWRRLRRETHEKAGTPPAARRRP